MTGSGATLGTHGILLGIGAIGPDGGTPTTAGRMTGTGITAMPTITAITGVLSATPQNPLAVITIYAAVYPAETMQLSIRPSRSVSATAV